MRKTYRIALSIAVVAALALALPAGVMAANAEKTADQKVVGLSPVQMQHWQNSTQNERYSFLIGLFSMMDMERVWQGKKELPVSQSINGTWVRGLYGKTLEEVGRALDQYALDNPREKEKPVLEVLGEIYVKPVLTKAEREAASDRYTKVKAEW